MAKFKLEFNTDNVAFDELEFEVARILQTILSDCGHYNLQDKNIRDINGNTVGKLIITED